SEQSFAKSHLAKRSDQNHGHRHTSSPITRPDLLARTRRGRHNGRPVTGSKLVVLKQEARKQSRGPPGHRISALVVIAVDLLKEGLGVECVGWAGDAGDDRKRNKG